MKDRIATSLRFVLLAAMSATAYNAVANTANIAVVTRPAAESIAASYPDAAVLPVMPPTPSWPITIAPLPLPHPPMALVPMLPLPPVYILPGPRAPELPAMPIAYPAPWVPPYPFEPMLPLEHDPHCSANGCLNIGQEPGL